ncbi:dolichyl-diphosphooligosaccharide--protein glycotransferase [Saccharomycopsis crataegensis]|uniref:Dolichyl-diphosphooligosaccharide--protein glycotransferase n=1 Tax=Saccharomycopsis crataegensis TaxID=43959 RepID=A0AAV5QRB9_9ASCO|nr:dolichyl-diphosphooligosaccharide--protein glycotransferase [Saccharomycopsis crataegensis]
MKLFQFIKLILFFVGICLAVKNPVPNGKKFKSVLSKDALVPLRDPKTGVVKLTDKNIKLIVNPAVREANIVVFLTANSPQIGCKACKDFLPIFQKTAKTFMESYPDKTLDNSADQLSNRDLFFIELDYSVTGEFFKSLKIDRVPHIWVVPSYDVLYRYLTTEKNLGPDELADPSNFLLKSSDHYQYSVSEGSSPQEFSNYISAALQISFKISNGGNDGFELDETTVGMAIIAISIIVIIKKKINDQDNTLLQKASKPRVWMGLSVLLICLFCSGYMFTVVRGVPLLARNEKGPFYFAGGSQYQIGIESFIVCGVYLFIGFWVVLLTDILPKYAPIEEEHQSEKVVTVTEKDESNKEEKENDTEEKEDSEEKDDVPQNHFHLSETAHSVLVIIAVIGLYYAFSLLTSIYLKKDGGYPFAMSRVL